MSPISKNYHDYYIKDGKFIGEFEKMYQWSDDPWNHGEADNIFYDLALCLLVKHKTFHQGGSILDIGCGKGALTSRLKKQYPRADILAVDIAPTAVRKAKDTYGCLGIDFRVMDIQREYKKIKDKFDLIVLSNIIWCILPNFKKLLISLKKNLTPSGHILIIQTFYLPGVQKYGLDIMGSTEDLLRQIQIMNYDTVGVVEIDRFKNPNAVILIKQS